MFVFAFVESLFRFQHAGPQIAPLSYLPPKFATRQPVLVGCSTDKPNIK